MRPEYIVGLIILALVLAGGAYLYTSRTSMPINIPSLTIGSTKPYREITNPSGFVNTDGITLRELIGKKVILVDFMTYSCINCQRTIPHVVEWYKKYQDEGLEIVGIHTPEFAFEKDINNVRKAMQGFGVTYPVVLDNDYGTWQAYGNQYWPRKYLIDIHGNIVYDHIGEGGYEETEAKIKELLKERASVLGMNAGNDTAMAVADDTDPKLSVGSPEVYFGAARNEYLENGTLGATGAQTFSLPATTSENALYLGGTWNIQPEYAEASTDVTIRFKYSARDVYIVASGNNATLTILRDGKPVGSYAGADVDAATGQAHVNEERLYKLIQDKTPGTHTIEIRITGGEFKAYTFTFG